MPTQSVSPMSPAAQAADARGRAAMERHILTVFVEAGLQRLGVRHGLEGEVEAYRVCELCLGVDDCAPECPLVALSPSRLLAIYHDAAEEGR